jgi:[acyl-carrier-protein] S-malonyltransferase
MSAMCGATAGLFPGQGTQTPDLGEHVGRVAPELHARCIELVGEDPFARVGEGTQYAQPAIFCASIAGWIERRERVRPFALAGHSLGELSALVAAGALEAASGLALAVRRGALMGAAGSSQKEGMLAVLGASPAQLEQLQGDGGLVLANDNAPGQVVLAGPLQALRAARTRARELGVRAIVLDVAGAFHSPSMAPAVEPFRAALEDVQIRPCALPVICGSTARPFADVRAELAQAIVRPVRWRQTMLALAAMGARAFVDFGPGEVLARLVARNLPDAVVLDAAPSSSPSPLEASGVA